MTVSGFEKWHLGPEVGFTGTVAGRPFEAEFEEKRLPGVGEDRRIDLFRGGIRRDSVGRVRTDFEIETGDGVRLAFSSIVDPAAQTHTVLDHVRRVVVSVEKRPIGDSGTWLYPEGEVETQEESDCPGAPEMKCRRVVIDRRDPDGLCRIESWTCEELKQVVFERRQTADLEIIYRLFNIRRGPPDADAFRVPPHYLPASRP